MKENYYNDITKLFYIIYDDLLRSKNQQKFIKNLIGLFKIFPFCDFKYIPNLKNLIFNIKDTFLFSYKMCLLSYIKCDLFNKLIKNYSFDVTLCEPDICTIVIKKSLEICEHMKYIHAFDIYTHKPDYKIDCINDNKLSSLWEIDTRNEIVQSLVSIVNYFSLNFLKLIGIKIITYAETLEMSIKELVKYYNKQILLIEKALKLNKYYCDSYVELEKEFATSLITSNDNINFNNFEIIIRYN